MFARLMQVHRQQPVLMFGGWSLIAAVPVLLLLAALDERTLAGEGLWLKPLKFTSAFGIYLWTLAWMLTHASAPKWAARSIAWGSTAIIVFEMVWIVTQAARGVRSHFNESTPLESVLFNTVGAAAHFQLALAALLLAYLLRPCDSLSPLQLRGVRWGLAVFLLAVVPGDLMVAQAAHTVGAADGGPGMPATGWSIAAGDLRIAHFLALHALQLFPLTAVLGDWCARTQPPRRRLTVWTGFATVYVAATLAVFVQAMQGQPLLPI